MRAARLPCAYCLVPTVAWSSVPVRGRAQSVCRIRPGNSDEQMLPLFTVALRAPSIIVESGNPYWKFRPGLDGKKFG
jgi:hypothetical protein